MIAGVFPFSRPISARAQWPDGRLPVAADESLEGLEPWTGRLPAVPPGPNDLDEPLSAGSFPEPSSTGWRWEPASAPAPPPFAERKATMFSGPRWEPASVPAAPPPFHVPVRFAQAPEQGTPSTTPGDSASGAAAATDTDRPQGDGTIGPRPPEEINRLALRGTSLLLKPGTFQYDFTALYVRQEQLAVGLLPGDIPVLERLRTRTLIAPMSLRYGWKENTELFAVVPFGVSMFEYDSPVTNVTDQTGVLGDISVGFARQLPKWKEWPDATLTFNVTAPTGANNQQIFGDNEASLGNGVWRLSAMLNLVESVDPFVFFGGVGYEYTFAKEVQGLTLQYGDAVNAYFGVGMAVTDDISLSAQVNASFQDVTSIEGIQIPNSDREPVSLRLALVRRLTLKSRVQPFVSWALTDDAPDYMFGVRFTHDW
jgi:hypothetical protein